MMPTRSANIEHNAMYVHMARFLKCLLHSVKHAFQESWASKDNVVTLFEI